MKYGKDSMNRVTYVKYNSLRKPEYRITTEIQENANEKWVVKRLGDPAARAHLEQIAANRELLEKKAYRAVSVLENTREGDQLRFPYVEGEVLAEKIDSARLDRDMFVEMTNQWFERILDVRDECKCAFEPTEGFVSWFGNSCPENGVPAVCPANIDSVFSNFIETKDGLVCLDYEWVFDFPVPVDYIKYRSIRYFYNERMQSLFDGFSRDTIMEWCGFDQEKQDLFWSMESHFQQRIYGQDWQYLYLNRYKKDEINIKMLDDKIAGYTRVIQEKDDRIRDAEARMREWENAYQVLVNSTSWKLTKPARWAGAFIKKILKK